MKTNEKENIDKKHLEKTEKIFGKSYKYIFKTCIFICMFKMQRSM